MHHTWRLRQRAALALAGLLACGPVLAQPQAPQRGIMPRQGEFMPGPDMGGAPGADMPGADPMQVLANSFEVQRDLGLNPHQIENLHLASRNFLTQMQELMGRLQGVPPEQARAAVDEQIAKTRPMINRELTPEQLVRFQQIMLQIQGPCAATSDPSVAGQLGLSGAQKSQIGDVCQDRSVTMRAAFQPPTPGVDPCQAAAVNRDRLMRIRADADSRVLALFTPEQRGQLARMEGRQLHLEPPMPPNCAAQQGRPQ